MTEQKKRIFTSSNFIKNKIGLKEKINTALVCYRDSNLLNDFKHIKSINYSDIPPALETNGYKNDGEFILASLQNKKKVFILNGRFNFFHGYSMRDSAHFIYVLRQLGIKNLILIDEVGSLNPRYVVGNIALVYDHINFMGTNPLIGENDNSLGPRFPDMSNAYDKTLFEKAEKIFIDNSIKYNPSVYLCVTGPETETEAECRFYRDIGSDVIGYSLVPENLAAVHSGLKCIAFGIITRELIADRLKETTREEMISNRIKAEKSFSKLLPEIIQSL